MRVPEPAVPDHGVLTGWAGLRVEQIRLDHMVGLLLGGSVELVIECPAVLSEGATDTPFDPGEKDFLPVLPLLHRTVRSAQTLPSGELQVVFEGGCGLRVPPDPNYEAWSAVGPGDARQVCLPGGGLAVG